MAIIAAISSKKFESLTITESEKRVLLTQKKRGFSLDDLEYAKSKSKTPQR